MSVSKFKWGLQHVIVTAILALSITQSNAGSVGPTEQTSWTGVYVGAQAGGLWGDQYWLFKNANYFNTQGITVLGARFDFSDRSALAGGILGFNYQLGDWVLGLEGELSSVRFKTTQVSPFFETDLYTSDINETAAIKARWAYAYEKWLFNLNGGFAFANVALRLYDPIAAVNASSSRHWNNGWTLGGGIDRQFTSHWSAGLAYEYSEIQVNNTTVTCALCGSGVGLGTPVVTSKLQPRTITARVSYLFSI